MTLTKEQIEYWRKAEARTDFEREMALIAESVMPESEPALPCELMVGNGHFHTGVKIATAQEAINRMFSRLQSLEQELERARKAMAYLADAEFVEVTRADKFFRVDGARLWPAIDSAIESEKTARRTSGDERG